MKPFSGTVMTGVHGDDGGKLNGLLTISEIAEIHEFGLGVPERSWLRAWFDEREGNFPAAIKAELEAAMKAGEKTFEPALDRFGVTTQGSIQKRISDFIPPENSPVTIARKGSSTPLIAEGLFRSAILSKVFA